MHIDEQGQGPTVVLLHGVAMDPSYFDPLVSALRPSRRVLTPHFPGTGKTPPVKGSYRMDRVQEELEESLLGVGVAEAAVVGTSLGAWRALRLAISSRVRVSRLVLLGGYAAWPAAHAEGLRGLAATVRAMANFSDGFRRQIALMFLAPANATPRALAIAEAWLDSTTPAALADELEAASYCEDLHPLLPRLRVPLLARVGDLDGATPVAYSESLVAAVPGAVMQRVPGCGHALLLEDSEATIAAVCRALGV